MTHLLHGESRIVHTLLFCCTKLYVNATVLFTATPLVYSPPIVFRFALFGFVLVTYDRDYHCNDDKLLKLYLCILSGIHVVMCLVEVIVIMTSARGTMANPAPRSSIPILLYIEAVVFVLKFAWDVVGVLWAFDPTIDCQSSHPVLLLARGILIWNLFLSIIMGSYAILRIGICRLPCCGPPKMGKYERLASTLSSDSRGLVALSSRELHHHQRRDNTWRWRLQWLFCCVRLRGQQRDVFNEISSVMTDTFTHFRGYVPSDVAAGIALMAMEQSTEKVR